MYLAQQYPPPTLVCGKTSVQQGHRRYEEETRQGRGGLETMGDFLILGLWEIQTDAIISFIFGDYDTDTYKY